jgi:hypothetical protein
MRIFALAALLLFAVDTLGAAELASNRASEVHARWRGVDGTPLPFVRDEELQDFLRTALIVESKELSTGKNRPVKVRLEKDGIQANAIFRTVNRRKNWTKIYGKRYRDFHDSCFYECAAYKMSRMLGLDAVPPCVTRNINGREGTLQLWIENAKTIKDWVDESSELRVNRQWNRQHQTMRVFDALISNFDRNQGNMLLDANGKLWFIDHTRSFAISAAVEDLDQIVWCERGVWEKMRGLEEDQLREHLWPHVDYGRIVALLKRRDTLVAYIQALIDERGQDVVLFDGS